MRSGFKGIDVPAGVELASPVVISLDDGSDLGTYFGVGLYYDVLTERIEFRYVDEKGAAVTEIFDLEFLDDHIVIVDGMAFTCDSANLVLGSERLVDDYLASASIRRITGSYRDRIENSFAFNKAAVAAFLSGLSLYLIKNSDCNTGLVSEDLEVFDFALLAFMFWAVFLSAKKYCRASSSVTEMLENNCDVVLDLDLASDLAAYLKSLLVAFAFRISLVLGGIFVEMCRQNLYDVSVWRNMYCPELLVPNDVVDEGAVLDESVEVEIRESVQVNG